MARADAAAKVQENMAQAKRRYLELLQAGHGVDEAARLAGRSRGAVRWWRVSDNQFCNDEAELLKMTAEERKCYKPKHEPLPSDIDNMTRDIQQEWSDIERESRWQMKRRSRRARLTIKQEK